MTKVSIKKNTQRTRRHKRIRAKVFGTTKRPRLSVFKSNKYVLAQLIDDDKGVTIAAVSSKLSKAKTKVAQAREAGKLLALKAVALKKKQVVFDRGGYIYTGRVKAVAEGSREGGLEF